jgi:hypothetical protein
MLWSEVLAMSTARTKQVEGLTPGVGLMTTVGVSRELELPPLGLDAPPMGPKRSGVPGCDDTLESPDG